MNNLDPHCQAILEEYRQAKPAAEEAAVKVKATLEKVFRQSGLIVAAIESRVKTEKSLAGKLELKGSKYASLKDITDIVGVRVITFYIDDVDKVASAVERLFKVDWDNSVDKRKLHEIDSFGYMKVKSLSRVRLSDPMDCSLPGSSIHGILQAKVLEWGAIAFSNT